MFRGVNPEFPMEAVIVLERGANSVFYHNILTVKCC